MNKEYALDLYEHNARSYEKVKEAFEEEDIVGIVHATGTGKSYNALQLAYDNRDKEIVYVVPSTGIIEHLEKIIKENPNLDRNRDFPNLHFRTYQSFVNLSEEEMAVTPCNLLVLDEFHHIGAPIWGTQISKMKDTHSNMKIFGMTAYTIRDRGTSYERDMANPEGGELFSNKIVSRYDLCDAMIDGVLPKPIYMSAYVHLKETELELEKMLEKTHSSLSIYNQCKEILAEVKRKIQEAPSIPELLKKSIKPNGKYIYFCPTNSAEGENDIETIKKQALEWFKQIGYKEEDIEFYTSTSEMGIEGKKNREAFYNDQTLSGEPANGKLRIMFAINQYNEGIHAPNIDGVIMGRVTSSDIVFFEQLGRALAVRGNTKEAYEELEKHSREELIRMCLDRDILIKVGTPKEEIIEKLLAPIIIDLTNNIGFIRELETSLKNRMKSIAEAKNDTPDKRTIKISDASFDITMGNEDLFEILSYVMDNLTNTWDQKYELAKIWYEHHGKEYDGKLLIPNSFKTINGYEYDENGIKLGSWISMQQKMYHNNNQFQFLSSEQIKKLDSIGMVWENTRQVLKDVHWNRSYEKAKAYYNQHGNLNISSKQQQQNKELLSLFNWIRKQKMMRDSLSESQIQKLDSIGMDWQTIEEKLDIQWERWYQLAKAYYNQYGNLRISTEQKQQDKQLESLSYWLVSQRSKKEKLSESQVQKLDSIGMDWLTKEDKFDMQWERWYQLAKEYYNQHGNLRISTEQKQQDKQLESLSYWLVSQRSKKEKLSESQIQKLDSIGMDWSTREDKFDMQWERWYQLAKAYYDREGNLNFSRTYVTEEGEKLGRWIELQRQGYRGDKGHSISNERIKKLELIGMKWDGIEVVAERNAEQWNMNYEKAKAYYSQHNNLKINSKDCKHDEELKKLKFWIKAQKEAYNSGELSSDQIEKLEKIGIVWRQKRVYRAWDESYEIAKNFYLLHGNLYITAADIEADESLELIPMWIVNQKRSKGLTKEQIKKLELIGIIWDTKKNREQVGNFCSSKGVNENKNKSLLKSISVRELQIKTSFLEDRNLPVVDGNGTLHPIFSMSSPNMKEEYGVTMEDLYANYYVEPEKEAKV